MTDLLNVQIAQTPLPSDLPFMNYGVTDIPANVAVAVDTTNIMGDGTEHGPGIVVMATTGDPTIGVTMEIIKAGASGRVRTQGTALMYADGAVTVGTWVDGSAASSKVGYAKAHTATKSTIGIALNTAATDGSLLLVLISRCIGA